MESFTLKQDYFIGYNHKKYSKGSIVSGAIHKDGKMLEVPLMVNCYNSDNSFGVHLDKLPLDILRREC